MVEGGCFSLQYDSSSFTYLSLLIIVYIISQNGKKRDFFHSFCVHYNNVSFKRVKIIHSSFCTYSYVEYLGRLHGTIFGSLEVSYHRT